MNQDESVLIGVGSNLNDPEFQIQTAINTIGCLKSVQVLAQSSLYQSRPQGPQNQNDFRNAVVMINTNLPPVKLLKELQAIEKNQGRIKTRHWGERVIDLDILFYGKQVININSPALNVPHPQALKRDFVIIPALEITPDWETPDGTPLASYKDQCLYHQLTIID